MLPGLNEDPPDTRLSIGMDQPTLPTPKHPNLLFLRYLLLGLLTFVIVFILTSLVVLYHFKVDLPTFIANTKEDVYGLLHGQQIEPSVTPVPNKKATWSVYRNALYHYSISYPSDWSVVEDKNFYTVTMYPFNSLDYANLTQNDIGAGIGPRMLITAITREFIKPDNEATAFVTDAGLSGYEYKSEESLSNIPSIDFPLTKRTEILEFSVQSIGQDNIDHFLKLHNSHLEVKDIDEATFTKIAKSLQFTSR